MESSTSKQAQMIQLLTRPAGAQIADIQHATGWQPHTVRATISSVLRKRMGLSVGRQRRDDGVVIYRITESIVRQAARLPASRSLSELEHVEKAASSFAEPRLNYTVASIIETYMAHYAREGRGISVTRNIIETHILPHLGDVPISNLTTKIISDWHYALSKVPARTRAHKAIEQKQILVAEQDPDVVRQRRSTANRILTVLKAALNHAWRCGIIDSDVAWRRVQPFRSVAAAIVRYLDEDECLRLVKACDADLKLIVQAALFTGCRYGEIGRLIVSDYRRDTGAIHVRITKSGKPRHVVLTEEGRQFFEQAIKDKAASDIIFRTGSGMLWGKSLQSKRMIAACQRAGIDPPISYHILRHTYGSLLAMKGAPMAVVAKQLGHANTQMTEKHYAHISPSYVAQIVRENFPSLNII